MVEMYYWGVGDFFVGEWGGVNTSEIVMRPGQASYSRDAFPSKIPRTLKQLTPSRQTGLLEIEIWITSSGIEPATRNVTRLHEN